MQYQVRFFILRNPTKLSVTYSSEIDFTIDFII